MTEDLLKSGRKRSLFIPGETSEEVYIDQKKIEQILPHRDPFLMVDRIDKIDLQERCIRGYRQIDQADPIFKGHFPEEPVYPGVLLLECIGQIGACLSYFVKKKRTYLVKEDKPRKLRLIKIREVSFLGTVHPGNQVTLISKLLEDSDYTSLSLCQGLCGGEVKILALFEVYWLD